MIDGVAMYEGRHDDWRTIDPTCEWIRVGISRSSPPRRTCFNYVLSNRDQLAWAIGQAGDWAEATRLLRELIPEETRIFGAPSPHHALLPKLARVGDRHVR
jgi:hypothetical protein